MNYLMVMPRGAAKSSGGCNVFPVGIAYVSANLRKHNLGVFTANLEFCGEDTFHELHKIMNEKEIDVICTSGLSRDYKKIVEVLECARRIKPEILTVVGGGIISGDAEAAMSALNADIGVIGEGEITMVELAQALDSGRPYDDIPGLVFRNGSNRYIWTRPRDEIQDIDCIGLPDYDGFDYSKYLESINYGVCYVVGSRSCPFACTFCFHPSGRKYRQRSIDNLCSEIEYLVSKYNVENVGISDELFATNRERVLDFCDRISPLGITWAVQLRVSDVDKKMLRIMREAGCASVSYGIESADNAILRSMKKHITVQQIERALKETYEENMDIQGGFIFGDVAETKETAANTLKWHSEHREYGLELNMINVFPGTALYRYACEQGIIEDRISFLKEGCPLINVSTLSDKEYRTLSSLVYERNMRAKYSPELYAISKIDKGICECEMTCSKCGAVITYEMDILHIRAINCPSCRQRFYVDPFQRIGRNEEIMEGYLRNERKVAIWGAGEICIKLLDNYSMFYSNKYIIVDISKSRQGYTVCGKGIWAPEEINKMGVESVIIAVVQRKEEIVKVLRTTYPCVKNVYVPRVEAKNGDIVLGLGKIDMEKHERKDSSGKGLAGILNRKGCDLLGSDQG